MPPPRTSLPLSYFPPPPPPQTTASPFRPPQQKNHSFNPSIMIIALIVTLVFLVSASIHLILRYLNRICHPDPPSTTPTPPLDRSLFDRHVPSEHQSLINSLPIFSFDSVATAFQKSAPDCAVCLSRFEHHDQLRLLPACCHAFHSRCIDTWLASNLTCPLCRSTILVDETTIHSSAGGESFRLEIGSVSRRETESGSRRSYSMGSFDYVVDDDVEAQVVVPPAGHRLDASAGGVKDKEEEPSPPGAEVAEAVGGRGWLKEYVDRLASSASSSFSSSRALSFRLSGRGSAVGSSRRSDGMSWDMDRAGEEVSNFFRWLTGTYA